MSAGTCTKYLQVKLPAGGRQTEVVAVDGSGITFWSAGYLAQVPVAPVSSSVCLDLAPVLPLLVIWNSIGSVCWVERVTNKHLQEYLLPQ
jgi:hypothetical protein